MLTEWFGPPGKKECIGTAGQMMMESNITLFLNKHKSEKSHLNTLALQRTAGLELSSSHLLGNNTPEISVGVIFNDTCLGSVP